MASSNLEILNEPGSSVEEENLILPTFPLLTKSHIINCSYHSWHPKYRSVTPKARLIPLPPAFLSYLRADGIILPSEDTPRHEWSDDDSGIFSSAEQGGSSSDDDDEDDDPSTAWREVHLAIRATIAELGGKVHPKLNWSAPKDATWISATNSMECRTPNDVYLLLKSSDFVTHDLEHVFDDCEETDREEEADGPAETSEAQATGDEEARKPDSIPEIPYHLVLRKSVNFNPSLEFRCFVRNRRLLSISQRDLNHFDFLFPLRPQLIATILEFFTRTLQHAFPDPDYAFDVYIPPAHERVWLIDVNPWAPRTDPLLFSWEELLTEEHAEVAEMPKRPSPPDSDAKDDEEKLTPLEIVRLHLSSTPPRPEATNGAVTDTAEPADSEFLNPDALLPHLPELRLVHRDDPEAYNFSSQQYSAHKLPRDVVDASRGGGDALKEFAERWKEIVGEEERQRKEDEENEG
ncbi:D123-domain-containing protein [Eremomyces bilateralis CBS 781.70]|uniref:D123-domain-containing protein n=1 Tax=Eremomyces bilateralis CBS 781.70 TaxID=1392243 RepID=A0A6G1FYX7_9PEZI|nr:D123-domain-containing protein [Eremomyces bilateralis CBS 781.70]KAF1810978.1 D123-domain-containing protein [Eremomyces bilateralis CBS 781.70]